MHVLILFDVSRSTHVTLSPWLLVSLRNIRILRIYHAIWSHEIHPYNATRNKGWTGWGTVPVIHGEWRMLASIRDHSSIQSLTLSGISFASGWEFLRLLASFPQLRSLIIGRVKLHARWNKGDDKRLEAVLACRPRSYSSIVFLQIEGAQISVSLCSVFPRCWYSIFAFSVTCSPDRHRRCFTRAGRKRQDAQTAHQSTSRGCA